MKNALKKRLLPRPQNHNPLVCTHEKRDRPQTKTAAYVKIKPLRAQNKATANPDRESSREKVRLKLCVCTQKTMPTKICTYTVFFAENLVVS